VIAGKWHTYPAQAAAGLWTTPEDLARFAIELEGIAAGRVRGPIAPAVARDMLQRQGDNWSLGVGILGEGPAACFLHSGGNEGFRALRVGCRERASGVVVMTNSDPGGALANELVRAVAREYDLAGLRQ
jgi:hypothetical protein